MIRGKRIHQDQPTIVEAMGKSCPLWEPPALHGVQQPKQRCCLPLVVATEVYALRDTNAIAGERGVAAFLESPTHLWVWERLGIERWIPPGLDPDVRGIIRVAGRPRHPRDDAESAPLG
jgi:hypothetical protein